MTDVTEKEMLGQHPNSWNHMYLLQKYPYFIFSGLQS
jgi:hypothetical protein